MDGLFTRETKIPIIYGDKDGQYPDIDHAIYTVSQENIKRWNKFLNLMTDCIATDRQYLSSQKWSGPGYSNGQFKPGRPLRVQSAENKRLNKKSEKLHAKLRKEFFVAMNHLWERKGVMPTFAVHYFRAKESRKYLWKLVALVLESHFLEQNESRGRDSDSRISRAASRYKQIYKKHSDYSHCRICNTILEEAITWKDGAWCVEPASCQRILRPLRHALEQRRKNK